MFVGTESEDLEPCFSENNASCFLVDVDSVKIFSALSSFVFLRMGQIHGFKILTLVCISTICFTGW